MSDSCFSNKNKKNSRPLSSSSPLSSSFLIHFKWFKTSWVHQLKLYMTSLYFGGKDATIKKFKLEILIFKNSPIIKNQTPFTPNNSYLLHSLIKLNNFWCLGNIRCKDTNVFWAQRQRNNVWGSNLFWLFKYLFTAPFYYSHSFWLGFLIKCCSYIRNSMLVHKFTKGTSIIVIYWWYQIINCHIIKKKKESVIHCSLLLLSHDQEREKKLFILLLCNYNNDFLCKWERSMKQINEIYFCNVCCQMYNIHFQNLLLGHGWLQRTRKRFNIAT